MHLHTNDSESGFMPIEPRVRNPYSSKCPEPVQCNPHHRRGGNAALMRIIRMRVWPVALIVFGLSCREAPARVETIPCPAGPGSESGSLSAGDDGRLYLTWVDTQEHAFK